MGSHQADHLSQISRAEARDRRRIEPDLRRRAAAIDMDMSRFTRLMAAEIHPEACRAKYRRDDLPSTEMGIAMSRSRRAPGSGAPGAAAPD